MISGSSSTLFKPSKQGYCYYTLLTLKLPTYCAMPGLTASIPFPEDVPTHPLLVIDCELVASGCQHELDKLWKAATELGFW